MNKVSEIYSCLCDFAPLELQMSFDNSGFQLGRINSDVTRVLLALDVTADVVSEAVDEGTELIISHHPLIFTPLKRIDDDKILQLIENRISVISMHTNLDIAQGGVNDALISALGAECEAALDAEGCGRVGKMISPISFDVFAKNCRTVLGCNGIRYYNSGKEINKIAVMGGSGGGELYTAAALGCDVYVTSDIKYNQFLDARELGISLIDAGHFCTENVVIPVLKEKLEKQFPSTEFIVSKRHDSIISFA